MKLSLMAYGAAPNGTGPAFQRWIEEGILPGGFLQAILANDLYTAVCRADATNLYLLREYYWWLTEHAPPACFGSVQSLKNWCVLFPRGEGMLERLEV